MTHRFEINVAAKAQGPKRILDSVLSGQLQQEAAVSALAGPERSVTSTPIVGRATRDERDDTLAGRVHHCTSSRRPAPGLGRQAFQDESNVVATTRCPWGTPPARSSTRSIAIRWTSGNPPSAAYSTSLIRSQRLHKPAPLDLTCPEPKATRSRACCTAADHSVVLPMPASPRSPAPTGIISTSRSQQLLATRPNGRQSQASRQSASGRCSSGKPGGPRHERRPTTSEFHRPPSGRGGVPRHGHRV